MASSNAQRSGTAAHQSGGNPVDGAASRRPKEPTISRSLSDIYLELRLGDPSEPAAAAVPETGKPSIRSRLDQLMHGVRSGLLRYAAGAESSSLSTPCQEAPLEQPDQAPDVRSAGSIFHSWNDLMRVSAQAHGGGAEPAAYLDALQQASLPAERQGRSSRLLNKLYLQLKGQPREPAYYRKTASALLQHCSVEEREEAVATIRDYYYFWLGDLRHRSGRVVVPDYAIRNIGAMRTAPLESLFARMRQEPEKCSSPALDIYLGQKFENGLSDDELASRETLLRALLVLLREASFVPDSYRKAVDKLLFLSQSCDRPSLVLMAREFFYYWIAFPPAATRNAV
jgi:hypothetical protein